MSVVGFDNASIAEIVTPQLTTVTSSMQALGATAVREVLAIARGRRVLTVAGERARPADRGPTHPQVGAERPLTCISVGRAEGLCATASATVVCNRRLLRAAT